MKKVAQLVVLFLCVLLLSNCSKKTTPGSSGKSENSESAKPVIAKPIKTPTPKVIAVNDEIAKQTFDGRLYYDLEGHRYWKNYKDGKYYIFNKSMATNPDFKKP